MKPDNVILEDAFGCPSGANLSNREALLGIWSFRWFQKVRGCKKNLKSLSWLDVGLSCLGGHTNIADL